MEKGQGSIDIRQLLEEEAAQQPKVKYSEGEEESAELIKQWIEADFDLDDKPEAKKALVQAIDKEFGLFESANPEPIKSDRDFLLKMVKFYDYYPRNLGRTSAFDYELGYLFLLSGLSGICSEPTTGRSYLFDILMKTRPYYNNPDLIDEGKKAEIIKQFPVDSDVESDITDLFVDLEVFRNLSPGNYFGYSVGESRPWDDEGYQKWKKTLPEEYSSEGESDMIANNTHWVGMFLVDLYRYDVPGVEVPTLYRAVQERAKARLDEVYKA